jgi:hypothetical protein
MLAATQAAKFVGNDSSGSPVFDIVLTIPDAVSPDSQCTVRQLNAAREFYCCDFADGLTYSQANLILSFREYAKSCADYILRGSDPKWALLFARVLAAFISSKPEIASYAAIRSNRRFHAGTESVRIARSKYFAEMAAFYEEMIAEMK